MRTGAELSGSSPSTSGGRSTSHIRESSSGEAHRLPACRATGCLWAQTSRDPRADKLLLQELQAREVTPQGHAHMRDLFVAYAIGQRAPVQYILMSIMTGGVVP